MQGFPSFSVFTRSGVRGVWSTLGPRDTRDHASSGEFQRSFRPDGGAGCIRSRPAFQRTPRCRSLARCPIDAHANLETELDDVAPEPGRSFIELPAIGSARRPDTPGRLLRLEPAYSHAEAPHAGHGTVASSSDHELRSPARASTSQRCDACPTTGYAGSSDLARASSVGFSMRTGRPRKKGGRNAQSDHFGWAFRRGGSAGGSSRHCSGEHRCRQWHGARNGRRRWGKRL